jgi:cytochrome P450
MSFLDSPLASARRSALPRSLPLPSVLQTLGCYMRPLTYLEHNRRRYGSAFSIRPVDMPPLVFLSDPHDIRAVITAAPTILHPGAGGSPITPIVGERSFMLQDEDAHMKTRRLILPAFRKQAVDQHALAVVGTVEREVASWPLDTPFALHPRLRSLTLRVILELIFGDGEPALEALHSSVLKMLSATASPVLQEPRLQHAPPWRSTWRQFLHWRAEADRLFIEIIRRRREESEGDGVLSLLLSASDSSDAASELAVRDNLMSVILAGHETTAAELAWAFQLIAHHPGAQSELLAEIDRERGDEYLIASIHEVLRHRPVFLFAIPRAVVQPVEIAGSTYEPPTQLLGCIYLLHHDPALYPDPHTFRPERFLGSPPQPWAWIPWGGGRKRCPGHRVALLEMQIVLRTVLATCAVFPADATIERARWRSVIVTPHAGSRIILRRRRPYSGSRRTRNFVQTPA